MTVTNTDSRIFTVAGDGTVLDPVTAIITGSFEQQPQAQETLTELFDAGFSKNQLTMFFVKPAAPPDTPPGGAELPPVDNASKGAASGAAVGGALGIAAVVASAPVLGPAAVALAGVGAYVGSFAGAVTHIKNKNEPDAELPREALPDSGLPRKAGTLIAVSAPSLEQQNRVLAILRAHGATDVERTAGTIVEGVWTDYDPTVPPSLVS